MAEAQAKHELVAQRSTIKGRLTRITNAVTKPGLTLAVLNHHLDVVKSINAEFENVQTKIDILEKTYAEDEYDEFFNKQLSAISKIDELITEIKSIGSAVTDNAGSRVDSAINITPFVKLPTINLPSFSGAFDNWPSFHETYNTLIHENVNLNNVQKFQYLKSCLVGEPSNLINSITVSEANYEIAYEQLITRYQNKRLLLKSNITALFNLPVATKDSPIALRKLIDKVALHVKVLKNLGVPTEHCDFFICHLIATKLDFVTNREWEIASKTDIPDLAEMISFLTQRCQLFETLQFNKEKKELPFVNPSKYRSHPNSSRALAHVSAATSKCPLCKGEHTLNQCSEFLRMSVNERLSLTQNLKLCRLCLKGNHTFKSCRQSPTCELCHKWHNSLLHVAANDSAINTNIIPEPIASTSAVNNHCFKPDTQVLLSTAIIQVADKNGTLKNCRALLDSGSQLNFITNECCTKLGITLHTVSTPIAGIGQLTATIEQGATIKFKSRINAFTQTITCSVLNNITADLPTANLNKQAFNVPKNIKLADPNFNIRGPIDILLGAEVFWNLLSIGQFKSANNSAIFQKTRLGWVVAGSVAHSMPERKPNIKHINTVTHMADLEQQVAKFWELENVDAHNIVNSSQCETHFNNTHTRDANGRFIVRLPFKDTPHKLGDSHTMALKRFYLLEKRLLTNPTLRDHYSEFINEYIKLGHMSINQNPDLANTNASYFMPHHAVMKPSSTTTKLRVVFDASAKTSSGFSLNDNLLVGPTIQPDLITILIRFRTQKYVLTGDISKMYRQIIVHDEDKPLQQILWRNNPNEKVQCLVLNTVTYGTACAPFLAVRCLQQLAHEEAMYLPLAKDAILNDFYVDDLITGSHCLNEAILKRDQIVDTLKKGGFCLTKWASNDLKLLPSSQVHTSAPDDVLINLDKTGDTKTLGLSWNCKQDILKYEFNSPAHDQKVTKRSILSITAQLFDPLGLLGPIIIIAKTLLQELWKLKLDWDESIPAKLHTTWCQLLNHLPALRDFKIPRAVITVPALIELHGFCDASERAYGACIYLRTIAGDTVSTHLLCAKSRVAPLKVISLPRLELCGAVLLTRLTHKLKSTINVTLTRTQLWTDSKIVLAWLAAEAHTWQTFVANRVSEIQTTTIAAEWRHIPSSQNPADVLSRGMLPTELSNFTLWWEGPDFLRNSTCHWPTHLDGSSDINAPERRKVICLGLQLINQEYLLTVCDKFSTYTKLQRTIAYCNRFVQNCRQINLKKTGPLSVAELNNATMIILKAIQHNYFQGEFATLAQHNAVDPKSSIRTLNPFLDTKGLIRVGGRLSHALVKFDKKHPIVLPNHHVTKLLIDREHRLLLHAGQQMTLSSLRGKYWPISGRNITRQVLRKCIRCFKANPHNITQLMGELPQNRVEPSRPFINCGVDYAGPITLREGRGRGKRTVKAYIAVFVCFATKATHIELVSDLTTRAFLATLKRFTSRRGNIKNMHSDNATNFVGANRELKPVAEFFNSANFTSNVINSLINEGITWHFIPPNSPHQGGIWEAGVKSVKRHLKRVVGNASLTFEEMYTVLTCIEACLNSRPLIPISNDPNDLTALTPGHFLIGDQLTAPAETDVSEVPENRLSRWQRIEQIRQHFWRRWSNEYLCHLQQRAKWHLKVRNIQIDTLVLIKEDNTPPLKWAMGRILAVHPGTDGLVRVVTIKTANSTVKRAITKVCPLPINS